MKVTSCVAELLQDTSLGVGELVVSVNRLVHDVWFSDRNYIDIIQIYDRIWLGLPGNIYIRINVRLCRAIFSLQLVALARFSLSFSRCDSLEDLANIFFVSWLIAAYRYGCI